MKQKGKPSTRSEQKGNRKIAVTAVKKPQSPANLRSSLVLGDQTLGGRYSICRVNTVVELDNWNVWLILIWAEKKVTGVCILQVALAMPGMKAHSLPLSGNPLKYHGKRGGTFTISSLGKAYHLKVSLVQNKVFTQWAISSAFLYLKQHKNIVKKNHKNYLRPTGFF